MTTFEDYPRETLQMDNVNLNYKLIQKQKKEVSTEQKMSRRLIILFYTYFKSNFTFHKAVAKL